MLSDAPAGTGRQAVENGARLLAGAGIGRARSESARLWEHANGLAHGTAWQRGSDVAMPAALSRFDECIHRRAHGEPLAYVVGTWGFRHLELEVTPDVLIPRPETEGLVELLLARVSRGRAADLGTGSGCIALSLACEGSFSQVVAVDASVPALAVARRNAARVGQDLGFVRADFGRALAMDAFDAVVSNPPYLSQAEYRALDPSVRSFEPRMALEGGVDGLDATRAVLADASRALRPGGWVALEIDAARAVQSARVACDAGFAGVTIHQDLFGRERFLLAQRSTT